jgi:hypothetical protein
MGANGHVFLEQSYNFYGRTTENNDKRKLELTVAESKFELGPKQIQSESY